MSVGTAIAVATLALLVVSARHWVSTVITGDGARLAMAGQTVAMLGGAIILILGLLLLAGSFGPSHPLGL
jgi:ABC-type nickel/cobalt efflux system permease component RcnA